MGLGWSKSYWKKWKRENPEKYKNRNEKLSKLKLKRDLKEIRNLTPNGAWLLGWVVSDGHIRYGNSRPPPYYKETCRILFQLNLKDAKELLPKFSKVLHYKKYPKLTVIKREKNRPICGVNYNKIYCLASFSFCSKEMVKILKEKYGFNENNGHIIPDIIFKSNDEIKSAFLRGIFEGDGSITRRQSKFVLRHIISICANKKLLEEIMKLAKELGIEFTRIQHRRNISVAWIDNRKMGKRFFRVCYGNENHFVLSRKYNKFLRKERIEK